MSKKIKRPAKPLKWKICTEGVTEANYLREYVKALGIEDQVDICCERDHKKEKGCGCKHLGLLNQMQQCGRNWRYEKVFLVHDYDNAAEDKIARKSFNETFERSRDAVDIYIVYSNPCFEFFLMLHTGQFEQDWHRDVYENKVKEICKAKYQALDKLLPRNYNYKSDADLFTYFGGLDGARKACVNAKTHFSNANPALVKFDNAGAASKVPCTNIFELLEKLDTKSLENK